MGKKLAIKYFYGASLILLVLFTVKDLQISIWLDQPQNPAWRFFEAFGEWPLNALAAISAIYLWQVEPRVSPIQRFAAVWCWGITALTASTLAGSLPLYFLTRDKAGAFPLWVILGAPAALASGLVFVHWIRRTPWQFSHQGARAFALATVYYFWAAQFIAHSIKIGWGRIRFRDLGPAFAGFSPWYQPQGITGNYSFPSGHALNAAAAFLIVLLPSVFPAIQSKVRIFAISASIWLLCVAISRVGIGAHFASDVTAGAILGVSLFLGLKHHFFDQKSSLDLVASQRHHELVTSQRYRKEGRR